MAKTRSIVAIHAGTGVWDFHCLVCDQWARAISSPKHAPSVMQRHIDEAHKGEERIRVVVRPS